MHFIDVGFKNSCSGNTKDYKGETVFFGYTSNDEEIPIVVWNDVNNNILEKVNNNLTSDELNEIKQICVNKKVSLSIESDAKIKCKGMLI